MFSLGCLALVFELLTFTTALDNGLARTPPMGWLSWERFRCNIDCKNFPDECISERLFKNMADVMVRDGYLAAGYQYVIIDDCWLAKERDASGRLQPDPDRFPSGIKALADYIHSKGLKLGIYEDFGTKTCAGFPGSEYYLEYDAQTFANWTVDYFKLDACYSDIHQYDDASAVMGFWLNKTGRPILYSCCGAAYQEGSGMTPDYKRIAKLCNIWRNYHDIDDSWDSVASIIEFYGRDHSNFIQVAGPGGFNDPDAIGSIQVWTKVVEPNGSLAFVFHHSGTAVPVRFSIGLAHLGLSGQRGYNITEVFDGGYIGAFKASDTLTVNVNPTGAFFGKAVPL